MKILKRYYTINIEENILKHEEKYLLFLSFIIIISKCYVMGCCDNSYCKIKFHINTEGIFNNHLKNPKTKNIDEVEKNLNTLKFQKITKQFNSLNEKGICAFISTIQNNFRNELFNANSKEETKDICEKYLTVSEMCKIDAEEKGNDISNLKFCEDNHRFVHYRYTHVLVKFLFGLLNKILEIGKKKKIFILDTPYVFSYFAMNEKMNKNEYKIKQKEEIKKMKILMKKRKMKFS